MVISFENQLLIFSWDSRVARYVTTGWMWDDVFSWKLLRFLKLRVIFALKTAKIGCTSAKHASKLDTFAFGLHYLFEQDAEIYWRLMAGE